MLLCNKNKIFVKSNHVGKHPTLYLLLEYSPIRKVLVDVTHEKFAPMELVTDWEFCSMGLELVPRKQVVDAEDRLYSVVIDGISEYYRATRNSFSFPVTVEVVLNLIQSHSAFLDYVHAFMLGACINVSETSIGQDVKFTLQNTEVQSEGDCLVYSMHFKGGATGSFCLEFTNQLISNHRLPVEKLENELGLSLEISHSGVTLENPSRQKEIEREKSYETVSVTPIDFKDSSCDKLDQLKQAVGGFFIDTDRNVYQILNVVEHHEDCTTIAVVYKSLATGEISFMLSDEFFSDESSLCYPYRLVSFVPQSL